MNLRWNEGASSFREGRIDPGRFYAREVPWATAKGFVERHHYSRSVTSIVERYGLYWKQSRGPDLLSGVAIFAQPGNARVLTKEFGAGCRAVELGRFVLLDEVAGNGETWFLGRCFAALRIAGYGGVLSFSDPLPRSTADGRTVFAGHLGTIYQAHNAIHKGRSTARTIHLLPDGTCFNGENQTKVRRLVQGWQYSAARLQAFGADAVWMDRPKDWLAHWLGRLTRPVRHPGNLRYLWGLDRTTRRSLPPSDPYLKRTTRCPQPS